MSGFMFEMESIQIHKVNLLDEMWIESHVFAQSLYQNGLSFHEFCDVKKALCGWIMTQNSIIVGRVAAYPKTPFDVDQAKSTILSDRVENGRFSGTVFLGNYECIDNPELSQLFFNSVLGDLKNLGFLQAIGPMTSNTWNDYRFKTSGDDKFLGETQQMEYYVNQWKHSGFEPIENYHSTQITKLEVVNEKIETLTQGLLKNGVRFRNANMECWEEELRSIFTLSLDSFAGNVFYEPIDWSEFYNKYKPYEKIVEPQWIELAENASGELIGFAFAIPNRMDREKKGLVLKTVARSKQKHYRGMGLVLAQRLHSKAHEAGVKYIIHAYMHSGNASLACSNTLHGKIFATYQLFEKSLH